MSARSDLDRAVEKPWSVYKTPEAVLADGRLSAHEKRRVLESWERDARELAVAEEENMGGGEPDMLGRVMEALSALPDEAERTAGPDTRQGGEPPPPSNAAAPRGTRLTGTEARQGEIILRTRARQAIFTGGLVLAAVACVAGFYAWV